MEIEASGNCKQIIVFFLILIFSWNYQPAVFSFGSLFSGTERLGDPMAPIVNMKYTGSAEEATPALTRERKALKSPTNPDAFDGDTL